MKNHDTAVRLAIALAEMNGLTGVSATIRQLDKEREEALRAAREAVRLSTETVDWIKRNQDKFSPEVRTDLDITLKALLLWKEGQL